MLPSPGMERSRLRRRPRVGRSLLPSVLVVVVITCCCCLLALTTVTAGRAAATTRHAFVPLRSPHPRAVAHFQPCPQLASAVSSTDSLSTTLQGLTVKELRQRVKDVSASERGLLSRLKRKQDLIDYLMESSLSEPSPGAPLPSVPQKEASPISMAPPLRMAPLVPDDEPSVAAAEQQHPQQHAKPKGPAVSRKDAIFERVYQRYPVLRPSHGTGHQAGTKDPFQQQQPIDDIRQWQHPIYQNNNVTTDMDLVFVGTASCTPGMTRGVSCTALRLHWRRRAARWNPTNERVEIADQGVAGGTWLFDVGECTQLQVQRAAAVRPSKITKIFLTHAHGDHTFGLPGLLCLMGQDWNRETQPPVEIYGPEGLRMWLRVAIRYSVSRIVPPYRVHELMDIPMAPEWDVSQRSRRFFYKGRQQKEQRGWGSQGLAGEDPTSWISQANTLPLEASPQYSEIEGGRSIYPQYDHPLAFDGAPVYCVEDEEDVQVFAAPMSHGIPCVGYAIHELPKPGRLRNELVEPIVKRNLDALRQAGFQFPMKAMAVIKNLEPGSSFTFPDGTVVTQEEGVEAQRDGRKVVICGDTCDSRSLTNLAQGADVIVHEATNAYLEGLDRDTNAQTVSRDAVIHGHSTPELAARFASSVQAQRLVMNHFSARYKGDASIESVSIMQRIEEKAVRVAPGYNETQIAAAWDLMVLPIPQR